MDAPPIDPFAPLDPARLAARRPGRIGLPLVRLDTVDSTNREAWRRVERGEGAHGLVVVAETQTAGRGRGSNRWFSPPGAGLWFSTVLVLEMDGERIPWITQVAGAQVAAAVERTTGLALRVKWPNDLLLDGRKAAGILTEGRFDGRGPVTAVLGVGLNVNQTGADFPPDLRDRAVSLRQGAGRPLDRTAILDEALDAFDEGFALLKAGETEALDASLKEKSAVLGRRVRVRAGGESVEGVVTEHSLAGGVTLRGEGGALRVFSGGSIGSLDLL